MKSSSSASGLHFVTVAPAEPFSAWSTKLMSSVQSNDIPSIVSKNAGGGNIDAKSAMFYDYKSIFSILINFTDEEFFKLHWEQHPVLYQRGSHTNNSSENNSAIASLKSLFSSDAAKQHANAAAGSKRNAKGIKNELLPGRDFNEVKYNSKQKRVNRNNNDNKKINGSYFEKSFSDGYTVQFFQPQRYSESLSFMNLGFEYTFGTLAGASAYLTPPRTQGLAPHYDDVEVFIFQTEGTKTWRIWKGPELPETYSHDIARTDLPKAFDEFVLYPGDMLYMPRGTIHEAISNDSFSTHVTFSVYQKYNSKALICQMLPNLIEEQFQKDLNLRKGLPLNLSEKLGTYVGQSLLSTDLGNYTSTISNGNSGFGLNVNNKQALKAWRIEFCNTIRESLRGILESVNLEAIDKASDLISVDFMKFRLPMMGSNDSSLSDSDNDSEGSSGDDGEDDGEDDGFEDCDDDDADSNADEGENGENDNNNDIISVRICDPRSFFCSVTQIDGVTVLAFQHSIFNDRNNHMGHADPTKEEDVHLILPVRLYPLIVILQDSHRSLSSSSADNTITIDDLEARLRVYNIDRSEIIESLLQLEGNGFLDSVVRSSSKLAESSEEKIDDASSSKKKKRK